jgi:Protein of unknown function (DUF3025)
VHGHLSVAPTEWASMRGLTLNQADAIDWSVPWLQSLQVRSNVRGCAVAKDMRLALNTEVERARAQGAQMCTGLGQPVHFVAQELLPHGRAYEQHIGMTGEVPTRVNLHDFFNAAVWLTFPKTKAVLNARQFEQIRAQGIGARRGMFRDFLTLFDENAAILVTSECSIANALRRFDWWGALVEPRAFWDSGHSWMSHRCAPHPVYDVEAAEEFVRAQVVLFGHALMEKLVQPRKSMCAHTWVVLVEPEWFALSMSERLFNLDERLSKVLHDCDLDTRDFCPLPVLGVPYFWPENQEPSFYEDSHVFRSGRLRNAKK